MALTTIGAKGISADLISAQTALTTGLSTTDEIIVSDAGVIKKMDISVWAAATETFTNKSIDLGTNTLTGSIAEFNAALQSESFATLAGTETLAAKTLTSPILNTGVSGTAILDSDTMSGVSATKLSSSESIKAYVDANSSAIDVSGTPVNNQLAVWTDADTLEGTAALTFDGTKLDVLVASSESTLKHRVSYNASIYMGLSQSRIDVVGGNSFHLYVNGSQKIEVGTGGDLDLKNGNVIIGTAGKGIDFSAQTPSSTALAVGDEVLDHYEEGTWTPILKDDNGNAASTSTAVGRYTRIGRLVHIQGRIACNGDGAISNPALTIYMHGIPFTAQNTVTNLQSSFAVGLLGGASVTAGHDVAALIEQNGSFLVLLVNDTTSGMSNMLFNELSNDGYLSIAGSYTV